MPSLPLVPTKMFDVLVEVGHAHDLVRHHLADGEHQIMAAFPQLRPQQPVATFPSPTYQERNTHRRIKHFPTQLDLRTSDC
jgi:hypothetical protein